MLNELGKSGLPGPLSYCGVVGDREKTAELERERRFWLDCVGEGPEEEMVAICNPTNDLERSGRDCDWGGEAGALESMEE